MQRTFYKKKSNAAILGVLIFWKQYISFNNYGELNKSLGLRMKQKTLTNDTNTFCVHPVQYLNGCGSFSSQYVSVFLNQWQQAFFF